MLVLSRKLNESIVINNNVTVQVVHLDRTRVRLGIVAPKGTSIRRAELAAEPMEDTSGTKPLGEQDAGRDATRTATQASDKAEHDAD